MANFNRVMLMGRLGADPEIRYLPSGDPVANFNLAVSEKWKAEGEMKERTDWFRCEVFGKMVDSVVKPYLKKGGGLFIEGRLRVEEWEKDGEKRRGTKVIVNNIRLLGSKQAAATSAPKPGGIDQMEDDIPF